MPLLKVDHVISFSSEDSVHVANNILSSDPTKKWKCKNAGEKNAIVVLQLEKASIITGIDIGNEHSAYVEILVSRSESKDDYKVLLTMCSFMTPIESRQSQNVNKVRMFSKSDLSKPECDEKWDRIKIVCTQPFNKHVQYGLSFITFCTIDQVNTGAIQSNVGKFAIRPASPDNLSLGSLFSKQKELKQNTKLTGAAAIRDSASSASLALHGSPVCKPKLKTQNSEQSSSVNTSLTPRNNNTDTNGAKQSPKVRNKNELFYTKEELEEADNVNKNKADAKTEEKNDKKTTKETPKQTKKKPPSPQKVNSPRPLSDRTDTTKRKLKDSPREKVKKKQKTEKCTRPFHELLQNVTLVISGIPNPDRGNLRSMALEMGAKYKPDWDGSCTHLICAFTNTPKYNQVKGKGKIVKRDWIEECHSQRKRLPWRRFALDKNERNQDESEEEILEKTVVDNNVESMELDPDDFDEHIEEASDTEDRLMQFAIASTSKESPRKKAEFEDVYSADTDVEEDCNDEIPQAPDNLLRNFFEDKTFYLDEDFDEDTMTKLKRYIIAYKGKVISESSQNPDIIIATKENCMKLKNLHPNVKCASPNWIWKCHNEQTLVSIEEFLY